MLQNNLSIVLNPGAALVFSILLVAMLLSAGMASGATDISGILRIATNYDYRGYTKSDNHPTVQANVDFVDPDRFFLGGWISSVDMGDARLEANPYLGKLFRLTPDWQLATSLAGYFFDGRVAGQSANYGEGMLQLDYRDLCSLRFNTAPDYYGSGQTVLDSELELRYPLADNIEVSAGLGYMAGRKAMNYDSLYGNLRVSWYFRPDLTLDLNYSQRHEMNERPHTPGGEELFGDADLDPSLILSISLGF